MGNGKKGTKSSLFQKDVDGRTRYYKISIYLTLFNEYLLEAEFGSLSNKKPTRVMKRYFSDLYKATQEFTKIYKIRLKRGYRVVTK